MSKCANFAGVSMGLMKSICSANVNTIVNQTGLIPYGEPLYGIKNIEKVERYYLP
jgi:hypothetical protein